MKISSFEHLASRLRTIAIPLAAPILLLYLAVGIFLVPQFISVTNITSILFTVAVLLPAIAGTQLLLVLGRFDLSVGAIASLSGMFAGVFLSRQSSIVTAVCLSLLVGGLVGLGNGLLISLFRIDPLIVTLAMMGITRSISLVINDGRIVAGLPTNFGWLVDTRLAGLSVLILFALFFISAAALIIKHTVVFRRFYAVGNNAIAAAHAGVNVAQLVTLGYIFAGIGAASTGLVQASRTLSASPLLFQTLAIEAITACIIGGSALVGGRGGMLGATVGLIVVVATNNLVVMLGISVYWKDFAVGLLLLLAVTGSPMAAGIRGLFPNHSKAKNQEAIKYETSQT